MSHSQRNLVLLALAALSCGPVVEVPGPPPEMAAPLPAPAAPATSRAPAAALPAAQTVEPFAETQDSDAWIAKSLRIQKRYARVLVVGANAPTKVQIAPLDLNGHEPAAAPAEYAVERAFTSLQDAANEAKGGDLVAVLPGTYEGFVIGDKPTAGDERYIHFKAMGNPGEVVINRGSAEFRDWMIYLRAAHHVVIEGFNIAGSNAPDQQPATGPRAGIMLDGAFGQTGKLTHHVAIVNNFSHNHRKWGLHSTDTHTVLLQGNLFALSAEEHGAYASDGSDNYVVRRNVFFNNKCAGFQANLDPEASFDEVMTHASFRSYPRRQPTRAWAEGLLKRATEQFGEHGFPDGRGVRFVIEDNVVNGNGRGGGGAINLAALSRSVIQNNLLYGNLAHGIAQWDNANVFDNGAPGRLTAPSAPNPADEAFAKSGPTSPEQVTGPEALPLFGCQGNVIRNNTVLMSNSGRAAIQCGNGSWGCVLRNNIVINDVSASIEVMSTSIYKLDAGYNVANRIEYGEMPPTLKGLAVSLPETRTATGVTRARVAAELVRAGEEPWVILEGGWWKLNPGRPDFRPKPWSKLLVGQGDARALPAHDLLGVKRTGADIGAFAPAR